MTITIEPTTERPDAEDPERIIQHGFVECHNTLGEKLALGMDVVLAPAYTSLLDERTFGTVRDIDAADAKNMRVGVLWYGVGGLKVRYYHPSQLLPATVSLKGAHMWEVAGDEDEDVAAREARQFEVRRFLDAQEMPVLGRTDEARQALIEEAMRAVDGATERDVLDVLSDLRWEANVATRQKRSAALAHIVKAAIDGLDSSWVDTEQAREELVGSILQALAEAEGGVTFDDEQRVARHVARQLKSRREGE